MLTHCMKNALDYLVESEEGGQPPTLEEIRIALGLSSRGAAWRVIFALQCRGFVYRAPHKTRGIRILRVPGRDTALKFNEAEKHLEPLHGGVQ